MEEDEIEEGEAENEMDEEPLSNNSNNSSLSLHTIGSEESDDPFEFIDLRTLSPFQNACRENNYKAVLNFIRKGAELNLCNNQGFTGLHYACKYGCEETVRILVGQPLIRIDVQNFKGETPLYLAAANNKTPAIIKLLTEAKCDVNVKTNFEQTALHQVIISDNSIAIKFQMAKLILESGFDFTKVNSLLLLIAILNSYNRSDLNEDSSMEEYLNYLSLYVYYNIDMNCPFKHDSIFTFEYNGYKPFFETLLLRNIPEEIDLFFNYLDDFHFNNGSLAVAIRNESPHMYEMLNRGADINYETENSNCLMESLNCTSNHLFKFFWRNCNKKKILKNHGNRLVIECLQRGYLKKFSKEDFLEMLYIILESEYADQLIERAVTESMYFYFVLVSVKYKLSQDERLKIIYTILTHNNNIKFNDLLYVYYHFGFDKEFEAFLTVNVNINDYVDGIRIFSNICNPQLPICYENIGNQPLSLLELSRDAFRCNMRPDLKKGTNPIYFQYYNKVKRMNIPAKIKDIILLRKII